MHSRKDTFILGEQIINECKPGQVEYDEGRESNDVMLTQFLHNHVGAHHAGMLKSDRKLVEDLFKEGKLKV